MACVLIVIDQQKGIDHPRLGNRNNPNAEKSMLSLMARWRKHQWPIIHIIHRSKEPDSVFWPEQDGFHLKPEFSPHAGEPLMEKSVPCAFTHSQLESMLTQMKIDTIALAGAATNNSIEATARHGGNLGFEVFVVEDACFTFDKADFFGKPHSAREVHAMSLANLNDEYATVLSSQELVDTFFS